MGVGLADEGFIVLEQRRGTAPIPKQRADPGPGQQAQAHLDAAHPVHALQEGIGVPPRHEMCRRTVGEPLVAGQPPGARQQRCRLVTGEFPDELDVADRRLVAIRDIEAVGVARGTDARQGIAEPVRLGRNPREREMEHAPFPLQQGLRRLHHRIGGITLGPLGYLQCATGAPRSGQYRCEQAGPPGRLRPPPLACRDGAACGDLARRHAAQAA